MDERSIQLINQTTRTRRIAFALILLALAIPSLFAWSDNVAMESAIQFTIKLAAVTLLAFIARLWIARHYSPGVQVQVLLAFAFVLLGWSGYVSRTAHEERVAASTHPANSMSPRIPN
jgi:hypothetical protein